MIHNRFSKVSLMRAPATPSWRIALEGKGIPIGQFTYLGSNMQASGDVQKEIRSQIGRAAAALTSLNKIQLLKIYILKAKSATHRPNYESSTQMLFPSEHMDMKPVCSPEAHTGRQFKALEANWSEYMKWNGFVTNVRSCQGARWLCTPGKSKRGHLGHVTRMKTHICPVRGGSG